MKCKDCYKENCQYRSTSDFADCILLFDWQSFRAEAAKDILCAMIARGEKAKPIVVDIAIDGADELIKQLKEK